MGNFSFLDKKYPDLGTLGTIAEEYYECDPTGCIIKLRTLAEHITKNLYYSYVSRNDSLNFVEMLKELKPYIPEKILDIMHLIRLKGNKAVHENLGTTNEALLLLKYSHGLATWFYVLQTDDREIIQPFEKPVSRVALLEKELEEVRKNYEKINNNLENKIVEIQKYKQEKEETEKALTQLKNSSHNADTKTARVLGFTEAETRKHLIDQLIQDAGWDINFIDPTRSKSDIKFFDTKQVKREVPVTGLPNTPSGNGYVDYVLYADNGKAIAIIEAKKTSVDVKKGKEQARQYANALEKMTGFRPLVFYTNGYDIYFWDDMLYPERKIYGLFSKEDVETRIFQRENRKPLENIDIDIDIINRPYQIEAVRKIYESFTSGNRKALMVMATGTGKTRTAMALIEGLVKANWVKRILFLVDRDELRKQANNAFKKHLDNLSRVLVDSNTRGDQNKRVYIATYPSMLNAYYLYTPGFFDLVIADESHRSIYNVYGEIFKYFDTFQIGLTATPVNYISRNTFTLFEVEDQYPTFNYDIDDAIAEKHLVPYKVRKIQTQFLNRGIKYTDLTPEQKKAIEEQLEDEARDCNFEKEDLEIKITNRETNRKIIKTLMDEGLKDNNGNLGKTIVFARSHKHGEILEQIFNELYPEYKGTYARLIDSHDPNASLLLDDFKGENEDNQINIAISISMLDTGVDVPEVLNLVFAKPIYSKVKFWQMIGRGTRLCPNLLAPGKDKEYFLIFDHYDNFEFFGENPDGYEPKEQLSLYERLFEGRINLAKLAKELDDKEIYQQTIDLIKNDINSLPPKSVDVMDKAALINEIMTNDLFWQYFDENFINLLLSKIKPLMKRQKTSFELDKALQFDIQVTQLQIINFERLLAEKVSPNDSKLLEKLEKKQELLRLKVRKNAFELRTNINKVQEKIETIEKVKNQEFAKTFDYDELEKVRNDLRLLMKYKATLPKEDMPEIDIPDDIEVDEYVQLSLPFTFGAEYKHDVEELLKKLATENIVLQKIKKGRSITQKEIDSLISIILEQNPHFSVNQLEKLYPDVASDLNLLIRNIIGIDEEEINQRITTFTSKNTTLNSKQLQCLDLIKKRLMVNKYLKLESFYDKPFTLLHSVGIDGLFTKEQVYDIYNLLDDFIVKENL